MKKSTVEIGRTYALRSKTGGDVQDANGDVIKTLEPGKQQHETAQESEWLVPDDCQVTKTNFKRAALALGLLGGGDTSGLPAGYTMVEYLEGTGTQFIKTDIVWEQENDDFFLLYKVTPQVVTSTQYMDAFSLPNARDTLAIYPTDEARAEHNLHVNGFSSRYVFISYESKIELSITPQQVVLNGAKANRLADKPYNVYEGTLGLFGNGGRTPAVMRFESFEQKRNGVVLVKKLIPAIDKTGAPCMFDLVSRKPFYNSGTGDFLYPGKETTATTYSLRRPRMYAQMTEHGIRRLYHVPRGFNGTPEEYAEQNGFKLLVETPAPEEGYWAPVWHEREDCIELEWEEMEPPAEEELTTIE